jgi:hypothetical protein
VLRQPFQPIAAIVFFLSNQSIQMPVIPAGTRVDARLESSIQTASSNVGDAIVAVLLEPIRAAGQIIVPQGSRLNGRVETIQPATSSNEGRVRLVFHMDYEFFLRFAPEAQVEVCAVHGNGSCRRCRDRRESCAHHGHYRRHTGGFHHCGELRRCEPSGLNAKAWTGAASSTRRRLAVGVILMTPCTCQMVHEQRSNG